MMMMMDFSTHRGKDRGVVKVAGERGQNLSVVCILLFILHNNFKWQFAVINADHNGSWAATQELRLLSSAFVWLNLCTSQSFEYYSF